MIYATSYTSTKVPSLLQEEPWIWRANYIRFGLGWLDTLSSQLWVQCIGFGALVPFCVQFLYKSLRVLGRFVALKF